MSELEQDILIYQQAYYDGKPLISDEEFDILYDRLKQENPNSQVLKKIGSDSSVFPKGKHIIVMGSQNKAQTEEEFEQWFNKQKSKVFLCQYKIDGCSLEIQYENGKLTQAISRGDGFMGDIVTENVKKMKDVVLELAYDFTGAVRGEVVMYHDILKNHFPNMANCRNAAVGTMKQKDGKGCEHLNIIYYDVKGNRDFKNENEKWLWLKENFNNVVKTAEFSEPNILKNIFNYRKYTDRSELNYDIDGLVIKCIDIDEEDLMKNRPDHQIAFKFDAELVETVLKDIDFRQSGIRFTPVAIFEPIQLCGTTVSQASIHNMDIFNEFCAQGLGIGSKILVKKSGEIIPQLEKVLTNGTVIQILNKCPICGHVTQKNGPFLECSNKNCPEIKIHQICKWIGVQNIMHLARKTLDKLMEYKLVNEISDLYLLTVDKVQGIPGIGQGFQRIIDEIKKSKNPSLVNFLAGFDIDGIGRRIWTPICEELNLETLEDIFNLKENDLISVNGIGEIRAKSILSALKNMESELRKTEKIVGISKMVKKENVQGKMTGMSFCFTGALDTMKRSQAEKIVVDSGGIISSVKKGLTYLVTNDTTSGSSKNKKAKELGISIINEQEFLNMI